jgi:hypothetical protein
VYREKLSGREGIRRPELEKAIEALGPGDVLTSHLLLTATAAGRKRTLPLSGYDAALHAGQAELR